MKIKMRYIYLFIILAAAITIILSGINSETPKITNSIPQDEIHKNMNPNLGGDNPSRDNVSSEFKHQLEMYKKIIDENPKDTLSMRKYAELLSAAHKPEEGNKYFEMILAIDPNRLDILTSIVFNYYTLKRLDKATEFNEKILTIDPNNIDAIYNKGVIEATKGNEDIARKLWERLIKIAPDSKVAEMAKTNLAHLANAK